MQLFCVIHSACIPLLWYFYPSSHPSHLGTDLQANRAICVYQRQTQLSGWSLSFSIPQILPKICLQPRQKDTTMKSQEVTFTRILVILEDEKHDKVCKPQYVPDDWSCWCKLSGPSGLPTNCLHELRCLFLCSACN